MADLHLRIVIILAKLLSVTIFFFYTTAPILALAYLHETPRFTSVFYTLDSR
jgi:hypothetical protein